MKNVILGIFKDFKSLTSEEIMGLDECSFKNTAFKLGLIKDKSKTLKVLDNKFYITNQDVYIKFQFDEICKRLVVNISKDIDEKLEKNFNKLYVLTNKVEFSVNSSFSNLLKTLKDNKSVIEVVRKDRYYNEGYEDELIISYIQGEK